MTLTLTADIDETAQEMTVTGTVPDSVQAHEYRFQLSGSDEVMDLVGFGPVDPPRTWPVDRNRWLIHRHMLGTTATTHSNGDTVQAVVDEFVAGDDEVAPDPIGSPGGPVSAADVTVSPTVAGASDVQGALEALNITVSDTAPDPVTGSLWVRPEGAITFGNDGALYGNLDGSWMRVGTVVFDPDGLLRILLSAPGPGGTPRIEFYDADAVVRMSLGDDPLTALTIYNADSTIAGQFIPADAGLVIGDPADGPTLVQLYGEEGEGGELLLNDETGTERHHIGAEVGFFFASPVAQPVVPLTTPTIQQVIDALVALGLVAQHD